MVIRPLFYYIVTTSFLFATIINVPADYSTIQGGINGASNGDTVLVQPGTYVENINFNGKNIVVGSLFITTEDDSYISLTIIDGNQDGSVVTFESGEDSTALLIGLTITNGQDLSGGGIYCVNSNPSLENVTITGNSADEGGGIFCYSSSPTLTNVTISGNSATAGGGIYCRDNSSPTLANVTISGNSAFDEGGGIFCYNNSNPSLVNSILWNDSPQEVYFNEDILQGSNSITIAYSDIQDGKDAIVTNDNGTVYWEEGNINSDPMFADTTIGDYSLQQGSPCIDAGTAFYIWNEDTLINLSPDEYYGDAPDIGAYESKFSFVSMYEAYVPHNTESIGPFALMFRIWDNPGEGFTFESGNIHYGIDAVEQSSLLIQTTYNDSAAYLGLIPRFDEVTGTTELSYYISADFEGGITLYWPPGAPNIFATMVFGPDTTAPIIVEENELTDIHNLLPFQKTVKAVVTDDRHDVNVYTKWKIGYQPTQSVLMEKVNDTSSAYIGEISDLVGNEYDSVRYWMRAVDITMNENTTISDSKSFYTHNYEVIADWENGNWPYWDLNGYVTSSVEFEEWGNYFIWNELPSGVSDTMSYNRPLDLTHFDEVWLTIPMWYEMDSTLNVGYFETSIDGDTWTVADSFTGTFGPQNVDISLIPYVEDDSLFIRFHRYLTTPGSNEWLMDDIILHTDTSRLTRDRERKIPEKFVLCQNYPNPFNPITTLRYDLPERSDVMLSIYDILGRQVKIIVQDVQEPGYKSVLWNGRNDLGEQVSAGVYLYQIRAGDFVQTRKMVLIK